MNRSSRCRPTKRLGLTALAFLLGIGFGTTQAGDTGPRHYAEGQYDAVTATYLVVEGDDLIAIGERFEVSVDELKAKNKLASDEIDIGQRLAIPGGLALTTAPRESTTAGIPGLGALTGAPANPQYKYSTPLPTAPSKSVAGAGARQKPRGCVVGACAPGGWKGEFLH